MPPKSSKIPLPYTGHWAGIRASKARFARRLQAFRKGMARNILTVKLVHKITKEVGYLTIPSAGMGAMKPTNQKLKADFFDAKAPPKSRGHTEGILWHILANTSIEYRDHSSGKPKIRKMDPKEYDIEYIYSTNDACQGTHHNHEDCANVALRYISSKPFKLYSTIDYTLPGSGGGFKDASTKLQSARKSARQMRVSKKVVAPKLTKRGQPFAKGWSDDEKKQVNQDIKAAAKKGKVNKAKVVPKVSTAVKKVKGAAAAAITGKIPKHHETYDTVEDMMSETASVASGKMTFNLVISPEGINENINGHNGVLDPKKKVPLTTKAEQMQEWMNDQFKKTDTVLKIAGGLNSSYA